MPSTVNLKMTPNDHRLVAQLIYIVAAVCLSIEAQNGSVDGDALARRVDLDRLGAANLRSRLRQLNREYDFGVDGL